VPAAASAPPWRRPPTASPSTPSICPGLVDTPFIQHQLADLAALHGLAEEEGVERVFLPLIPQRRMLDPHEIATMVRYLASEEVRGTTGQAITVSAGWIMH
jgi:3-hydroxybutyrate dehydrogenase